MAVRTLQQQLDDLDAAIVKVETTGQNYSTGDGRTITRGNLATFINERRRLRAEISNNTVGNRRVRIVSTG